MSVKTIQHALNLGAGDLSSGWSPGVWGSCPWDAIREGELPGLVIERHFGQGAPATPATTEGNYAEFAQFGSTGGFLNVLAAAGGVGSGLTLGSDGDNEGASIRTRVTPFILDRTNGGKFWFEARVRTSTIADANVGWFLGLMDNTALTATVPIAADGTLADVNLVGFHRLEGDGDALDTVYRANGVTAVTVQADAKAIAADTWYKLGMVYDPDVDGTIQDPNRTGTRKFNLSFYVDGVRVGAVKQVPTAQGTDFPNDVGLGIVFAVLNATATSPGTATIQKFRAAQIAPV